MDLRSFYFTFIAAWIVLTPAHAQFVQQGSKLTGSGVDGPANQGIVALSSDGNTALVGGPGDDNGAGAVWVWTRTNGIWTEEAKLIGTGAAGNANQGRAVALSADGNTALIGGFLDHAGAGAAWVWVRRAGVWTQQGNKLVGTGAVGGAGQGLSVALSADGNTALIGGYNDNGGIGAVWVWTRSGDVWTQQGSKLIGSGAEGVASQGYAVALSGDGNTALIGGFLDSGGTGAAWVWKRTFNVWKQEGSKLVGSGARGPAYQGVSVALSSTGNTALVGGFVDDDGTGAAWAWTRSGGVWTQQGEKLVGAGAAGKAYQGVSVALSSGGGTALIGGFLDRDGAGAAWLWARSSRGVWSQQGVKLVGMGAVGNAAQGRTVALSGDGNTAMAGGAFDKERTGAAWVYARLIEVSQQVAIAQTEFSPGRDRGSNNWTGTLTVTNIGAPPTRDERAAAINGPIDIVFAQLPQDVPLANADGFVNGRPYIRVAVQSLAPGESVEVQVEFKNPDNRRISFVPMVYASKF